MFFKNLKKSIIEINKFSIKLKKKRVFILSNTSDPKLKKYLTPVRESANSIFCGSVVFNDKDTKKIVTYIKEKIDYIFVDTEKKASLKNKNSTINIERTVRENIDNKKIFYFKANDLSVNASSDLLENLFYEDIRNISNKKILIIGSGNIGFKLGLNLIERGTKISLYRRNKFILSELISVINKIKPKATINKAVGINKLNFDLSQYDVIINTSNSKTKIFKNNLFKFNKKTIFLEIGKNLFDKKTLLEMIKKNKKIFRLDMTNTFNQLIEQKINSNQHYKNKIFARVKKKNKTFITVGLLGKKDDIVVDNPLNPKKFYGVIDKNLSLIKINRFDKY